MFHFQENFPIITPIFPDKFKKKKQYESKYKNEKHALKAYQLTPMWTFSHLMQLKFA